MYKIAVVGDKDSILGFKTIGFDVFAVPKQANQIQSTLEDLITKNYAIIYLTEPESMLVTPFLEKQKLDVTPAIITIPSQMGNLNLGFNQVKEYAKKAIGIDIL